MSNIERSEKLGKIEKVIIGKRCADSPFGIYFTFSGSGWGVQGNLSHFGFSYDIQGLRELCLEAKVNQAHELKNIPVRVFFDEDSRMIVEARILTEVL